MRPKATIYKSGGAKHGQVYVSLPKSLRLLYHFGKGIGLGLLTAAIAGIIVSYGPIFSEEASYQLKNVGITTTPDYSSQIVQASEIEDVQKEAQSLNLDPHFALLIPKIDAKSNIIANVDPSDPDIYSTVLSKGIAHAKGTYFPGQGKSIFLFAHSTNASFNVARYNAVFYLLSKLEKGDEVVVYFADHKYLYRVTDSYVSDPFDTSILTKESNTERLYLMTCTPPGTTWQRLFVIAEPVPET
jgi:sortase A